MGFGAPLLFPGPAAARRLAAAVAAPFSPLSIPGLLLWLKADGVLWQDSARTTPATLDGDPVGGMDDASGNGRHVTQATSTKRPTLRLAVQNGRPVARFDGVDDNLRAAFTLNQPHTRFAVLLNRSSQVGNNLLLDGATNDSAYFYFTAANTATIYAGAGVSAAAAGTGWNVWRGTFDGAASKVSVNAGAVTTGNAGAANAGGVSLAARGNGIQFFCDCDVAEVLEYDSALSGADAAKVFAYLNGRWAIY